MAKSALQLDETLSEAHTALGFAKDRYDWDWAGAEKEFRRGIELAPNYATGYHLYGIYLGEMGRPKEACAMIRRAQQLDPLAPNITQWVALCLFLEGHYEQAFELMRKMLELEPNRINVRGTLRQIYERRGMYREETAEYEKAVELSQGKPSVRLWLAHELPTPSRAAFVRTHRPAPRKLATLRDPKGGAPRCSDLECGSLLPP